jgi:hypothetical protein
MPIEEGKSSQVNRKDLHKFECSDVANLFWDATC